MGYASAKSIVGLDIEPGYVSAVQSRGGQATIEKSASVPLASGIVRDGEVVDIDGLAAALKHLFAEHKLSRKVRLGVANQRIVMRTLDLPAALEGKELASAVRFQAQDHIPMSLEQAVIEHHSLGTVETAEGPRSRVVIVAARRDMIERLLEATRRSGLRPVGIDLSAFALIRALHRPGRTGTTLYLSVGGLTNLAVANGTTCVFTRVLAHGTESIATELAERRGLTLEHAHGWLRHVGLLLPVDDVEGDREIVVEARSVLSEGVRRIATDARNSLDYHAMQDGGATAELTVLSGPAVAIPGFADRLGLELGLPLEVGLVQEARAGGLGDADAGRLAVAMGLAVEEVAA